MSENNSMPPLPAQPPPFAAGRNAAIGNGLPIPKPAAPTQPLHGAGINTLNTTHTARPLGDRAAAFNTMRPPATPLNGSGAQTFNTGTLRPGMVSPAGAAGAQTFGTGLQRTSSMVGQTPNAGGPPPMLTAADLGVKFVDHGKNPADITEDDRKGWKSFRSNVAREILSTEKSYVDQLTMMIKAYHDPYVEGKSTGLTDKKVAALFTMPKVIINVAQSFLVELEKTLRQWDEKEEIAPVFLQFAPMFRIYKDFAISHSRDILTILKKINSRSGFPGFQEKQMKALGCMSLESYLITPIQRIPRYKLLLESIISKTESTSDQAQNLLQALKFVAEVALSVNEAMKAAELVQRYMDVQKMFDANGELVHLWRKLLHEIPCKVTRIWSQLSPQREDKPREKKEKKHKFVGHDATLFVFTDCIYLGVKEPSRVQKYDETRRQENPYPLFSGEYNYKFSLLTMGLHSLGQAREAYPVSINDYTYHYTLALTSPVFGAAVSFDTYQARETAKKNIQQAMIEFPQARADAFYDNPVNGKSGEVLCCDRCSCAIFTCHITKESAIPNYLPVVSYFACNKCNGLTCTKCIQIDESKEAPPPSTAKKIPGAYSLGGVPGGVMGGIPPTPSNNKVSKMFAQTFPSYPHPSPHESMGMNVLDSTGRNCKHCHKDPPKVIVQRPAGEPAGDNKPSSFKKEDARPSVMMGGIPGGLSMADLNSIKLRSSATPASPSVNTTSTYGTGLSAMGTPALPNNIGLQSPGVNDIAASSNSNLSVQTNSMSQLRNNTQKLNSGTFIKPPESPLSQSNPRQALSSFSATPTNEGLSNNNSNSNLPSGDNSLVGGGNNTSSSVITSTQVNNNHTDDNTDSNTATTAVAHGNTPAVFAPRPSSSVPPPTPQHIALPTPGQTSTGPPPPPPMFLQVSQQAVPATPSNGANPPPPPAAAFNNITANNSNNNVSIPPTPQPAVPRMASIPPTPSNAGSGIPPPVNIPGPPPTPKATIPGPPPTPKAEDTPTTAAATNPSTSQQPQPKLSPRSQFKLARAKAAGQVPPETLTVATTTAAIPPPPPSPLNNASGAGFAPPPPPPSDDEASPISTPPVPATTLTTTTNEKPASIPEAAVLPPPTPAAALTPKSNDFTPLVPTLHQQQQPQQVKRADALAPKAFTKKIQIDEDVPLVVTNATPSSTPQVPVFVPPPPVQHVAMQRPPPQPPVSSGFRAPIRKD